MGKIQEIIDSGKAPGFDQKSKDEGWADKAVPRALKQLEGQIGAREIARQAGFSVNTFESGTPFWTLSLALSSVFL